ncbi:hypothetical protein A4A49_37399 [Nicotiana attenuata]|uniref:Uncharacterized protein n=1 Tax=Nicotiana attenuata TaxID=49451 RepID=A0A1J6JZG8_NICAT|nr:hypothetical protein A4A49_37399 [Nicotiana attenuata]
MDGSTLASAVLAITKNAAVAGAQFGTSANVDSAVQTACSDAAAIIRSGVEVESQHGQQSQAMSWSVVHRSPSKKEASDLKNLERAAETFKCSNSFDALLSVHEQGEKDSRNILQLVQGDIGLKDRQTRSPGSVKEQQIAMTADLCLGTSKDIVPMPTLHLSKELVPCLNSSKEAQDNGIYL